jgi:hypothetical protein
MGRTSLVIVILAVLTATGFARPPYPAIFQEHYAENQALVAAAKAAKPAVCQRQNASCATNPHGRFAGGKPRNEYGLALGNHLPGKEFRKLQKPEQKAELAARLKEALKATEADKNKTGDLYGKLLKAGQLPVPPVATRDELSILVYKPRSAEASSGGGECYTRPPGGEC